MSTVQLSYDRVWAEICLCQVFFLQRQIKNKKIPKITEENARTFTIKGTAGVLLLPVAVGAVTTVVFFEFELQIGKVMLGLISYS